MVQIGPTLCLEPKESDSDGCNCGNITFNKALEEIKNSEWVDVDST